MSSSPGCSSHGFKEADREEASELMQVLEKLESMDQQLQCLSTCQESVENYVKWIYQDIRGVDRGRPSSRRSTGAERASEHHSSADLRASIRNFNPRERLHSQGKSDLIARSSEMIFAGKHSSEDRSDERKNRSSVMLSHELGAWPRKDLVELEKHTFPRGASANANVNLEFILAGDPGIVAHSGFLPLHPDSWNRAVFDFMSLILLLYDSLMIPYQFAWPLPLDGWFAIVSWSTAIFWTTDMMLGFLTGYYEKDKVVMNLRRIARHYLRTEFPLNAFVVAADLGGIIAEELANQTVLSTPLRLLRFVKLERILKLATRCRQGKVAQVFDALNTAMREKGWHQHFNITMRAGKLIFCIMWVNHVGCCVWRGVGKEAISTWHQQQGIASLGEEDSAFSYMLGLYWSANIMVSGGSMMMPTTTAELIMAAFSVVFGFVFTSVIISSLLSTVIEYQESNKERHHKLTVLRQFLYQHKVCSKIAVPIVKQAMERLAHRKRLSEGDVEVLSALSPTLRSELWYDIYGPSIAEHYYFNACRALDGGLIRSICFSALSHTPYSPGDPVFEPCKEAKGAFFVCHGSLSYRPTSFGSFDLCDSDTTIGEPCKPAGDQDAGEANGDGKVGVAMGAWISEVAIWAHWLHRGWLDATTICELLTVQAESLVKVMALHPKLVPIAQNYSACLLKALGQEPSETFTDLVMPVAHSSVVAAMPLAMRKKLNKGVLTVMRRSQTAKDYRKEGCPQALPEEAQSIECDLVLDAFDTVHRVVNIVGLRLLRWDHHAVLVQIGEVIDGKRTGSCQPPSTKIELGEYPREALKRLVADRLYPFSNCIQVGTQSQDQYDGLGEGGLQYRYMRTLYEAESEENIEQDIVVLQRVQKDAEQESRRYSLPSSNGRSSSSSSLFSSWVTSKASRWCRSWSHTSLFSCAAASGSPHLRRTSNQSRLLKRSLVAATTTSEARGRRKKSIRFRDPTLGLEAFVFHRDLVKDPNSLSVYSWVSPEDLSLLCAAEAAESVQRWMDELLLRQESDGDLTVNI